MRQLLLRENLSNVHQPRWVLWEICSNHGVMQAPSAIALVLRRIEIPLIITAMVICQFIIDTLLEWARAILLEILGRRIERFVRRSVKRWREKKSAKANADTGERT
jgi:hypothetical protein